MKNIINKKYSILKLLAILLITIFSIWKSYADVPYEVWKTKTTSTAIDRGDEGIYEVIIKNWKIINDSWYNPWKWKLDTRVKTRLSGIKYSLEFRNVWIMWNKGWTSFGGYEKAKLIISFNIKEAYHMYDTGITNPMFNANYVEEKEDEIEYIDDLEFDLVFSWWPYWDFTFKDKKWTIYQIWHVVDWKYVQLNHFPYNMTKLTLGLWDIKIPVWATMFTKWMEKLIKAPCKDSWIRFNDYNWEVMYRPDDDEEAWASAEMDAVLCVNTHIRTWDDSFCILSLNDMTSFRMKPNSELILSSPPERESKFKLIMWKIFVNVKQMLKDGTMDVEMSQAVAWIKWTIFELEETWTQSKIKVFEWTVEFKSKATWKKSMVWKWETQTATSSGLWEKTTKDNREVFKKINKERQEWLKMKKTPLKPLLSKEEIAKIKIKDSKRWEIKLDPDSVAPDWTKEKKWVFSGKDNSSNNILLLFLLIIIIAWGYFYLKK